jgi:uncharacterized protein DUF4402
MRKLSLVALAFVTIGLLAAATASAQNTATTSANATARIITPISLTKNTDMNFGDVVASGSLGTVILSTAAARSTTGGASLGSATGVTAGSFAVAGQPSATYAITLPASVTVDDGATHTMTVDTFNSNPSGTGALSGAGTQTLLVGATLHVGANQVAGSYTGSFNVTVTYN